MTCAAITAVFVVGCAIKPPPAEPEETAPTWARPSVQHDCEAECAEHAGDHQRHCVDTCEHAPRLGNCIVGAEWADGDGPARWMAIPVGIAGTVVVSLLAFGAITP